MDKVDRHYNRFKRRNNKLELRENRHRVKQYLRDSRNDELDLEIK